jgi:hypothetical protein
VISSAQICVAMLTRSPLLPMTNPPGPRPATPPCRSQRPMADPADRRPAVDGDDDTSDLISDGDQLEVELGGGGRNVVDLVSSCRTAAAVAGPVTTPIARRPTSSSSGSCRTAAAAAGAMLGG